MNNAINTINSNGVSSSNTFNGNPKFKNVKLVSPTDAGYQRYRLDQIGAQLQKNCGLYPAAKNCNMFNIPDC